MLSQTSSMTSLSSNFDYEMRKKEAVADLLQPLTLFFAY